MTTTTRPAWCLIELTDGAEAAAHMKHDPIIVPTLVRYEPRADRTYRARGRSMSNEDRTEEIEISVTWKSINRVTVPYGWRPGKTIDDSPEDILEQITTENAEIVDWSGPRDW